MIDIARLREILAAIDAHRDMRASLTVIEQMLADAFGARFTLLDGAQSLSLAGIYAWTKEGGRKLLNLWINDAKRRIAAAELAEQVAA